MKYQIDLTYFCNLHCKYCNRWCDIIKSKEYVTEEQIHSFISEILEYKREDTVITIAGGEPLLHPNILNILKKLKENFENAIIIQSNGVGEKVNKILRELKNNFNVYVGKTIIGWEPNKNYDFIIYTKDLNNINHILSMIAPIDYLDENKNYDYEEGCKIPEICGIGVTPYGYYPCAGAGSIDRIFGFDLGIKHYPSKEELKEQRRIFCRLCFFKLRDIINKTPKEEISLTWKKALYNYDKVELTKY